jgi:hypothetical protein
VHVQLDQIDHLERPPAHRRLPLTSSVSGSLSRLEDHTGSATHVLPIGNYVIARVGNYVIVKPSDLGNFVIADTVVRTLLRMP